MTKALVLALVLAWQVPGPGPPEPFPKPGGPFGQAPEVPPAAMTTEYRTGTGVVQLRVAVGPAGALAVTFTGGAPLTTQICVETGPGVVTCTNVQAVRGLVMRP